MAQSAIDVVRDLGCQMGADATALNASLISGSFSAGAAYKTVIPAGDLYTRTGTITLPNKTGVWLQGQGSSGGGLRLGKPTRIVAEFDDATGTVIKSHALQSIIENLEIIGRPVEEGEELEPLTEDVDPALVGLHITTHSVGGQISSKCLLRNLAFWQCDTDLLLGYSTEGIGDATFTGEGDANADTVWVDTIYSLKPYGGPRENTGRVLWIRSTQSMGNNIGRLICHGNPAEVAYIERGGNTTIGLIDSIGSNTGTTVALRVGRLDAAGPLIVNMIHLDNAATGHKCFKMDDLASPTLFSPRIEIGAAHIGEAITAVPQFDCQPASIYIRNADALRPDSIKLVGKTNGSSEKFVCSVHLVNCKLYGNTLPADLIHGDSAGPYHLTWTKCQQAHDGASPKIWGRPILDGEILSSVTKNS
jgi:hypothetical protein